MRWLPLVLLASGQMLIVSDVNALRISIGAIVEEFEDVYYGPIRDVERRFRIPGLRAAPHEPEHTRQIARMPRVDLEPRA